MISNEVQWDVWSLTHVLLLSRQEVLDTERTIHLMLERLALVESIQMHKVGCGATSGHAPSNVAAQRRLYSPWGSNQGSVHCLQLREAEQRCDNQLPGEASKVL